VRAIVLHRYGGPEVLEVAQAPDPAPGPEEVLVRVRAAGVNRADLLQRQGRYPPPGPAPAVEIPGLEFAGEVVAAGPRVQRHRPGDRVFGLLAGGGYAELVAVHERLAMPTPPALTDEEAAAVPEAYLTAWDALFAQAGLRAGEVVLVHAVGSGVGIAALQLALGAGATVFGTSRSEDKCRRAMELGAALAVFLPGGEGDFAGPILRAGGRPPDVILDLVGGAYLERNLQALAPLGRLVVLSTVAGARAPIDLGLLMRRRLRILGSTLRARAPEEKMALVAAFERLVLPQLAAGRLRPVLARVLPWTEAAEAHRCLEADAVFGKVVLRVD
jgi:NADPH2:quinone reductase